METFGDTSSLNNFLKSLEPELLIDILDDADKGKYAEIDSLIIEIVSEELDYNSESPRFSESERFLEGEENGINPPKSVLRKWRKDFKSSIMNEIKIRYGAIATNERHSTIVGFVPLKYTILDDELLEEIIEDRGRLYSMLDDGDLITY
jgi:hypothetical protein